MQKFGDKVRTLRMKYGLTIRQLAEALDIKSSGHITAIEKGKKKPSMELLLRMSYFFNVTTDQLLKDELDLD